MGKVHHKVVLLFALVAAVGSPGFSVPQKGGEQDVPLKLSTQLLLNVGGE